MTDEAFKRDVSDAIAKLGCWPDTVNLQRFILPKPDPVLAPLVEALGEYDPDNLPNEADAENLRAALAKRGGKIVWENEP